MHTYGVVPVLRIPVETLSVINIERRSGLYL